MQLYIVCYIDEDGDSGDLFVTAETPEEAFAMWRCRRGVKPEDHTGEQRCAEVYEVPAPASEPTAHAWDSRTREVFDLDHETLATRAVEAVFMPKLEAQREAAFQAREAAYTQLAANMAAKITTVVP